MMMPERKRNYMFSSLPGDDRGQRRRRVISGKRPVSRDLEDVFPRIEAAT